jgi:two-component system phosphate regulon sensor histidine kinase PhoR
VSSWSTYFWNKPRNIAITIALGGLISTALIVYFSTNYHISLEKGILLSVVSFILVYFISLLIIKTYVFERIRLIYQKVLNLDSSQADSLPYSYFKNTDPLEKVDETVSGWLEKQQSQISSLKKQEEFRREFLGNVAHELKTPIFSMQGYVHTLLDGGLEDESINRKYLLRASYSIDRMIGILDDLDTITRLDSQELKLNVETFDIVVLSKEIAQSLELQAKDRDISLNVAYKSDKPLIVKADRYRVGQVLTNLIVNAIKYGNEGGFVRVEFHDLHDALLVEVVDNGSGIEEKHLPRLFERFYRVDKHRSRQVGGSGLGLAIVKHIVEAHKQKINVRSKVGLGSTFAFTLKKVSQ